MNDLWDQWNRHVPDFLEKIEWRKQQAKKKQEQRNATHNKNMFAVLAESKSDDEEEGQELTRLELCRCAWIFINVFAAVVSHTFETSVTCLMDSKMVSSVKPVSAARALWKEKPFWDFDDWELDPCYAERKAVFPAASFPKKITEQITAAISSCESIPEEFKEALLVYQEQYPSHCIYPVELLAFKGDILTWRPMEIARRTDYQVFFNSVLVEQNALLNSVHINSIGSIWETPSWLSVAAHSLAKKYAYHFTHHIPKGMQQFYCAQHFSLDPEETYHSSMRSCKNEVEALSTVFVGCDTPKQIYDRYKTIITDMLRYSDYNIEMFKIDLALYEERTIAAYMKFKAEPKPEPESEPETDTEVQSFIDAGVMEAIAYDEDFPAL